MHNYLHVLLHANSEQIKNGSTEEGLQRSHQLFKGTFLHQRLWFYTRQPNQIFTETAKTLLDFGSLIRCNGIIKKVNR